MKEFSCAYPVTLVLEYINEHLDREIKLADLAQLRDMSQFHFSHMFKRAIGIDPYQYPIEQRVERAKQLLKRKERSIDYGHCCIGVGSTATVIGSKKFRQFTGMTPRVYRAN